MKIPETIQVHTSTGEAMIWVEHISAIVLTPINPNNVEIHLTSGTIFTVTSYKGRRSNNAHKAILKDIGWGV